MSTYFVAQWSIPEVKKEACEEAIKTILAHIQGVNPKIPPAESWDLHPATQRFYEQFC